MKKHTPYRSIARVLCGFATTVVVCFVLKLLFTFRTTARPNDFPPQTVRRMAYSGGYADKEEDDLKADEEEEEGGEMKTVNDHCILLIDARPNMFEPLNDDGDVRDMRPCWCK